MIRLQRVREVFALYDHRSGKIDSKELRLLLDQLGLIADPDKLSTALDQLDPEGCGEVSWARVLGVTSGFKGFGGYLRVDQSFPWVLLVVLR